MENLFDREVDMLESEESPTDAMEVEYRASASFIDFFARDTEVINNVDRVADQSSVEYIDFFAQENQSNNNGVTDHHHHVVDQRPVEQAQWIDFFARDEQTNNVVDRPHDVQVNNVVGRLAQLNVPYVDIYVPENHDVVLELIHEEFDSRGPYVVWRMRYMLEQDEGVDDNNYSDHDEDSEFEQFPDVPAEERPASRSFIENLESVVFTQESLEENGSVVCAVCKDEFNAGEMAKKLPCSHYYHEDCILPWLEIQFTCPLCRTEFPEASEEDDDSDDERQSNERAPHA